MKITLSMMYRGTVHEYFKQNSVTTVESLPQERTEMQQVYSQIGVEWNIPHGVENVELLQGLIIDKSVMVVTQHETNSSRG